MSCSVEEIAAQLRLGEDGRWEFKQIQFRDNRPVGPRRDDLADELAAFANERGGVLLCGVTDDGEVQGMSREQLEKVERLIADACADLIKPPIEAEILRLEVEPGKPLLVVEVAEGYAQHDSPGGAYRRLGSNKRKMSGDERLRLAQRRSQARLLWFDQQPVPQTGFRTLEESLWKPLLSAEGRIHPERALQKLALLASGENAAIEATVAGILLCTSEPEKWLPNACISATHYRGEDRSSPQLDAQVITGPLHRQVAEAVRFAARNMRVGAYKSPARMDLPQYSLEALFEALVNAVVHRDYTIRGSRTRLSMFAGRVEINSPGGLANNLTIESMRERQATRNEAIASALARMPVGGIPGSENRRFIMERRGDGVSIIFRTTRMLSGHRPEYRLVDESDLFLTIPAAETVAAPGPATVSVRESGRPVSGADLLVLFPNATWKRATTDQDGDARLDLYSTTLPMTVFVAASGYAAHVERDWIPSRHGLAVTLRPLVRGGSVIFEKATGPVPGLRGRLNPKRDAFDRTYLYADNIAINDGQPQPVHFTPGEDLRLTDAGGVAMTVRVIEIVGRAALVEYRPTEGAGVAP